MSAESERSAKWMEPFPAGLPVRPALGSDWANPEKWLKWWTQQPMRAKLDVPVSSNPATYCDPEANVTTTKKHDERIATMTFASVYPHYVAKVEKKGRTVEELHEVIAWLTGFDAGDLERLIREDATFERFFAEATIHPNASLITGTICGYRIEEIETPLTKQVRWLDKLVDELAKGRKMDKILRTA